MHTSGTRRPLAAAPSRNSAGSIQSHHLLTSPIQSCAWPASASPMSFTSPFFSSAIAMMCSLHFLDLSRKAVTPTYPMTRLPAYRDCAASYVKVRLRAPTAAIHGCAGPAPCEASARGGPVRKFPFESRSARQSAISSVALVNLPSVVERFKSMAPWAFSVNTNSRYQRRAFFSSGTAACRGFLP